MINRNKKLIPFFFVCFSIIGTSVLLPGESCGNGLSVEAAKELDLTPGIPVSASIIDAHAGGLGRYI